MGTDEDFEPPVERGLVNRIVMMWRDPELEVWKEGMEHSLSIDEIMTKLGDPPQDTAEWRLRRNNIQSILTTSVQKWFFRRGLYFGGIHVKKGEPVRYVLAESAEEFYLIYNRYWKRLQNSAEGIVEHRRLVRQKMLSLPESHTRKRKLLGSAIRKSMEV